MNYKYTYESPLGTMIMLGTLTYLTDLFLVDESHAPTYDDAVHEQIDEVSAKKKYHNFRELLMTNDIWEVK